VLRFRPAPGNARRRIVAEFQLNGLTVERRTVATFMPLSPRLTRPATVTLRRTHAGLFATWSRVPGATRYDVVVTLKSGAQNLRTTRRTVLTLAVRRSDGGRVQVRGVGYLRKGGTTTARFAALEPAVTRIQPLRKPPKLRR
jgi:hypothetical protein